MSKLLKKVGNKIFGEKREDGDDGERGTSSGRKDGQRGTSIGRRDGQRGTRQLLHGTLDIEIKAARNLPDTDNGILNLAKRLNRDPSYYDVTDPYVSGTLGTNRIFMTSVKQNELNPEWNESFSIPVCHVVEKLIIEVKDKDDFIEEPVGSIAIPVKALIRGGIDGWHDIINKKNKNVGQLNFIATFTDVSKLKKQYTIDSYFPVRTGCNVDLYSCARNSPTPVTLCDGKEYQPGSCYLDMFRTILEAEKFIYITGWSVWTDLKLVRETDMKGMDVLERNNASMSLGELLMMKAKTGVKVAIMIWSDASSNKLNEKGMMGTHDMTTFNFFKDSCVDCKLVPREVYHEEKSDFLNHGIASTSYTHHQKIIIADTLPIKGDKRRTLTAYVGGLDLTDGRYDTPEHPLFKSLVGVHKYDFYQGSAPGITNNHGPRQPWQDIHTRLTGRIALDVFVNFKERWHKQGQGSSGVHGLYKHGDISDEEFNLDGQKRNWNVQLLRSITNDSAAFSDSTRYNTLTMKKNTIIEESIMKAYVTAIRSAEKFIYVENQYFLGSAYAWETDNKTNCHHCIPAEIAEKVASKILNGEEFAAYIVIPLHPEGNPKDAVLQEILAWQRRTINMMYKRVGTALKQIGSSNHPTDYLLFLCLVKKEKVEDIPAGLAVPPENTTAGKLRKSRRFMIYVHSKLMIVDDSVALVGSANINQRSLSGSRDTEIAVSCHQPEHTLLASRGMLPQGQVARFRIRLFQEHLGTVDTSLQKPHTASCVQFVKETCAQNWQLYIAEGGFGGCGHLIRYPIEVSHGGDVTPRSDCVNFPDTSAKIQGAVNTMIPEKLTT